MTISIMPFPRLLVAATQFGYPVLCCVDGMKAPTDLHYVQWIAYWMMCAVWMILEYNVLYLVSDYIPFFLEIKLLGFLWLAHPDYKGATYLYYKFIQQHYKVWDEQNYEKTFGALTKGSSTTPTEKTEEKKAE
eukprot:gnl/TRDRNA2_/TRDRNA2_182797_c0_seq1.p1 gnl/TRDRNA2_/TRDRNA2_182797_c0~~gnl/TRDRNA2_/TRDRNA2_182797_c0_seq1.p1  ORF type:complete len:133 (-),score=32.97 gnl/TRDRNA2_/TRDRNA2_182797_c0_seq1:132-530(-)